MRSLLVSFVVVGALTIAAPHSVAAQNTTVIGFEGISPGAPVPVGYQDLIWTGVSSFNTWYVTDHSSFGGSYFRPSSGLANAISTDATALYLSALPGQVFDLNSLFLSEISSGGTQIMGGLLGFRDGQQVYSQSMFLNETTMTQYVLNWTNVDRVVINGVDGKLAVDDISVTTATPEPGTILLLATGLVGVAGWRRRASKNNTAKADGFVERAG